MDKTVMTVIRMSLTLRSSSVWPSCVGSIRLLRNISHEYDANGKDLPSVATAVPSSDSLLTNLRYCSNPTELFHLVDTNYAKMNNTHAITALSSLFILLKDQRESVTNISNQREFVLLCKILNKNLKSLSTGEILSALKTLCYLNIPATSLIMQSLLQMIRHSVNQLSLQQIIFLQFLLKNLTKTPLIEALEIALPIVFLSNLEMKIDKENINMLAQVLRYLRFMPYNEVAISLVLKEIYNYRSITNIKIVQSIYWTMCELKYVPSECSDVIYNMQQLISKKLYEFSPSEVTKTLARTVYKIDKGYMGFYNQPFIEALAMIGVSKQYNFSDVMYILKSLNLIGYIQMDVLEYLVQMCCKDPNILTKSDPIYIAHLVRGLSIADYKPFFWDNLQEMIIRNEEIEKMDVSWLHFCISLASLDCYSSKFIELAFTQNVVDKFYGTAIKRYILLLYQAVKTLYPVYNGPWPSQNLLDFHEPLNDECPLLPALEKALGGPQYICSKLRTKLGHRIDYAVVMRKGGYPVAINCANDKHINNSLVYLEDLEVPSESQVILILDIPYGAYAINCQRLKGNWTLYLKTLEAYTTHTAVPINTTQWTALPDHEKIPYLMRAISLKHNNLSAAVNVR